MEQNYVTERVKTNNLTLLTDLYQLTMMNGYHLCGLDKTRAVFDVFYRGAGGYSSESASMEMIWLFRNECGAPVIPQSR